MIDIEQIYLFNAGIGDLGINIISIGLQCSTLIQYLQIGKIFFI